MPALVVDLGGTHLRCGVAGDDGTVTDILRVRLQSTVDREGSTRIWVDVVSAITGYAEARGEIPGPIVVAFPGPVEDHSRILSAPTLHGDTQPAPDLHGLLMRSTGRAVHLINDVSAAAWHESRRTTPDRFVVVTVSSGIGSKLFDRHHPARVLDSPAYAGEIGHMVVDASPDAPPCDCGGRGHLGAIASGRGILALARTRACSDGGGFSRSACVTRFGAAASSVTNEGHLVPAAREGDPWALAVITDATRPLARMLVSVVLATGVRRVIIIGGFALSLGPTYIEVLRRLVTEVSDYHVLEPSLPDLLQLGHPDSCLLGAAVFATQLQ